jgi:hypothetical protein
MATPRLYYIMGSDNFFKKGYNPWQNYQLKVAESLTPDDLSKKMLDFYAVALRLGGRRLDNRNDGLLSLNLNLAKPIVIRAQGPIDDQTIRTLNYSFPFRRARRNRSVGGIDHTPTFRNVSVKKYLTQNSNVRFSLDVSLAKSGGDNTNTVVELTSRILRDPAVSTGLIANLPVLGIASAVFDSIRKTFFSSGQARTIWNQTSFHFRGGPGGGFPLKAGRYVFASMRERPDRVEDFYRYRAGRLVAIRRNGTIDELRNKEQFYLDIYAY